MDRRSRPFSRGRAFALARRALAWTVQLIETMSNRINATLVLSLCMTSGLQLACDAPSERDELELEASPADEAMERGLGDLELVAESDAAAKPHGPKQKKLEKLMKSWTRWAMEEPWSTGPINDPTGASCAMGQGGPVWFLAGTSGGPAARDCTIPAGKKLFFPLVNAWWALSEEFYPTEEEREAIVPEILAYFEDNLENTCALTLRLDGQDVVAGGFDDMVDELYLKTDHPFDVELNPADHYMSPWGITGGPMTMMAAGHFAWLAPLTPGDHVLEFGGVLCDGEEISFETSVTYELHVE